MLAKVPGYAWYLDALRSYADCCTYAGWLDIKVDRRVVIHRTPEAVQASVAALGLPPIGDLEERAHRLRGLDGMHIGYDEIDDVLPAIRRYLELPGAHDRMATEMMKELNVQMRPETMERHANDFLRNVEEARRR